MSVVQDVPLFEGIISDLFPGVESPQPDFGVFLESLKDNIAKQKLQPVPWFIDKIIQVYTTVTLFLDFYRGCCMQNIVENFIFIFHTVYIVHHTCVFVVMFRCMR